MVRDFVSVVNGDDEQELGENFVVVIESAVEKVVEHVDENGHLRKKMKQKMMEEDISHSSEKMKMMNE